MSNDNSKDANNPNGDDLIKSFAPETLNDLDPDNETPKDTTETEKTVQEKTEVSNKENDSEEKTAEDNNGITSVADSLMAELQADKEAAAEMAAKLEVSAEEKDIQQAEKELDVMGQSAVEEPEKKKKTGLVVGIVAACVLLIAGGILAYFFVPRNLSDSEKAKLYANGKYIKGISIYGDDVSNKSLAEAKDIVNKGRKENEEKPVVILKLKDKEIALTTKDLESDNTLDAVLKEAMIYGREGSIVSKNKIVKETEEKGKDFVVSISTNEETLNALTDQIVQEHSVPLKEADVQINKDGAVGEKFIYTEEQVGLKIDSADLKTKLKAFVDNGSKDKTIELAYNEEIPKTKIEELKKNMVQISSYSTNVGGVTGRLKNVEKAGQIMNGTKVMPGEVYDLEAALGPRNGPNGWFLAKEIIDQEFVDGYGGGICQASTTLFNAVLRADLEVVDRSNHSLTISYVPLGFDAAISAGGPKFNFRNNTEYPIFIFASSPSLNKLVVEIYGRPFSWGETTYKESSQILSSGAGGAKKVRATLTFLDKDGNVQKTNSWLSNYGSKKEKPTTTEATTAAPSPTPTHAPPTTHAPTTKAPTTKLPVPTTATPTTP